VDFARTVLLLCSLADSGETEKKLAETAKGFYHSECAKSRTGEALPARGSRKSKTNTGQGPTSKQKTAPTKSTGNLAQKCTRILPTFVAPPSAGSGDTLQWVDKAADSVKDTMRHSEMVKYLDQCPKKYLNAFDRICDTAAEDKKILNSEKYRKFCQEWCEETAGSDPAELEKVAARSMPDIPFWKSRYTITALKQYQYLKKVKQLLTASHLKTLYEVYLSLSNNFYSCGKVNEKDQDLLIKLGQVPRDVLEAEQCFAHWKGSVNLGRIHPRVIMMQLAQDNAHTDVLDKWTNLFDTEYFDPILLQRKERKSSQVFKMSSSR